MSRLIRESIGFVSLCTVIIQKTHATLSTNQMQAMTYDDLVARVFPRFRRFFALSSRWLFTVSLFF